MRKYLTLALIILVGCSSKLVTFEIPVRGDALDRQLFEQAILENEIPFSRSTDNAFRFEGAYYDQVSILEKESIQKSSKRRAVQPKSECEKDVYTSQLLELGVPYLLSESDGGFKIWTTIDDFERNNLIGHFSYSHSECRK